MRTETLTPPDFDEFWQASFTRAMSVDPAPTVAETVDQGVSLVSYTSLDGVRLGAWLVLPEGATRSAVIMGHGYGGRDLLEPRFIPDGAAALYPIARGLPLLSLIDGIPATGQEHVLVGIESRETYIIGRCVADLWIAVTAFEQLLQGRLGERHNGLRLGYYGPSFGGGVGSLALPWDDRFDAASLYVPTFGDHPRRLAEPSVGSGSTLSQWVEDHPEAWEVLPYFDAATAAARIRVPTVVAPAHVDPAVPPVGQWAVAEAIPAPYSHVLPMTAGHQPYAEEQSELAELARLTRDLFAPGTALQNT